ALPLTSAPDADPLAPTSALPVAPLRPPPASAPPDAAPVAPAAPSDPAVYPFTPTSAEPAAAPAPSTAPCARPAVLPVTPTAVLVVVRARVRACAAVEAPASTAPEV